jgi:hypothetical protein
VTPASIARLARAGKRFAVRSYPGVAFWFAGAETEADEDTAWSGIRPETGRVLMVMVGDDRRHVVDPEDVTELAADAFCRDCGQIGCGANVWEAD